MNAGNVAAALEDLLREIGYMDADDLLNGDLPVAPEFRDCSVSSYEDAGIMTRDRGFVLKLASGEEFQVTIVRSN